MIQNSGSLSARYNPHQGPGAGVLLYSYMVEGIRVFSLASFIQTLIHLPGHDFKTKYLPIILPPNVSTLVRFQHLSFNLGDRNIQTAAILYVISRGKF